MKIFNKVSKAIAKKSSGLKLFLKVLTCIIRLLTSNSKFRKG